MPRRLADHYQPGVDGVAIRLGDRSSLIRPSQMIAGGFSVPEAIDFVVGRLGLTAAQLKEQQGQGICMRFRTLHFWQPSPDAPVVQLDRGCVVLDREVVTPEGIDQAIRQVARYLRDRQRPNGFFAHAYLPWADRMEESGPTMDQAGAAWALAIHGAWARDPASIRAASRAVDALAGNLAPAQVSQATRAAAEPRDPSKRPATVRPAYLKAPEQADRLGATAMLLLAASEIQPPERYRDLRTRLAAGIATRQLPTGMMQANFVTTRQAAPQDTDPGLAMFGLVRCYQVDRIPAALQVVRNACDHYQKQFTVDPSAAMVPWQALAYSRLAQVAGEPRFMDHVFAMVDWLERFQLTGENGGSSVMDGGIDPLGYGGAGVTTALYMTAVADALELARLAREEGRIRRYERMLRAGTRFVLQLQFRPEECYYVRSRSEAIGGIRTTPWDHSLTIENCRHALVALIRAKQMLF